MKRRLQSILLLFLVSVLVLGACGGDSEEATALPETPVVETETVPTEAPTEAPTEVPTEAPTATPVPPTATPDPTAGFELYTNASQGISLRYPADWILDDSFFITLATGEELLDGPDEGEEGAFVTIISGPAEDLGSNDPMDLMDEFMAELLEDESEAEVIEGPTATTINGQDAAVAVAKGPVEDGEETLIIVILATIINGDQAAVVIGITPEETEDEYRPVIEAIINSVEVTTPVVSDETDDAGVIFTGDSVEGSVAGDLPSSWQFFGFEGDRIDIVVEPLTDSFDVVVDVRDGTGSSILPGGAVDSSFGTEEILDLEIPSTGDYAIVIYGFAGSTGDYELSVSEAVGGGGDGIPEGETRPIAPGVVYQVTLAEDATDNYVFTAVAGEPLVIIADSYDNLDVQLEIYDADGNFVDGMDDAFSDESESLEFTPEADGEYTVTVNGFLGDGGDYAITILNLTEGAEDILLQDSDVVPEDGSIDYTLTASGGDAFVLAAQPEESFDIMFEIYGPDGELVESRDDLSALSGDMETHIFFPPADGEYTLSLVGFVGTGGAYELTIGSATLADGTITISNNGGGSTLTGTNDEYDTVFPLPDDVQSFTGQGGETAVNYQTSLTLDEVMAFYRQELTSQGLTERELLTVASDTTFSFVFDGAGNGKAVVVQGVDLTSSVNVNIRFEDI